MQALQAKPCFLPGAAVSSSNFVEFCICFTMNLKWLVMHVNAQVCGVTSNTKLSDTQF